MLELRHVGFETDDNKEILRDVSLTVQDRFVAITGPNGGGKSTLAKVIAGIYQPTSGQILLDGVDITHMSITDRANLGLSYAFQQPVRFKGLRVKDLLSLAAGKNTSVNEACSYLSEVGLCARDGNGFHKHPSRKNRNRDLGQRAVARHCAAAQMQRVCAALLNHHTKRSGAAVTIINRGRVNAYASM